MRSLSPLLQLPFLPFTRSLGGWIQGEGRDHPPDSSVHFTWKWTLRNSAKVRVCISVSPSPRTGFFSRSRPVPRLSLVYPGPVTPFLFPIAPLLPECLLERISTTPLAPSPSLLLCACCVASSTTAARRSLRSLKRRPAPVRHNNVAQNKICTLDSMQMERGPVKLFRLNSWRRKKYLRKKFLLKYRLHRKLSHRTTLPDSNAALWSRAEDDLLVQAVAKCRNNHYYDWHQVAE